MLKTTLLRAGFIWMAVAALAVTTPLQAGAVDAQDLEAAVHAYLGVIEIQEEYHPRIEAAGTPEEAQQLQQEANAKMLDAIEGEGLEPEEYNEIIAAVQQDEELRQQFIQLAQEIQDDEN